MHVSEFDFCQLSSPHYILFIKVIQDFEVSQMKYTTFWSSWKITFEFELQSSLLFFHDET